MSFRQGDDLQGKVALVTGAARNIGRGIARTLAAGGAAVMVNALTSEAAARETVATIEAEGGRAACFIADVTDPAAVDAMVAETVDRFGGLDILINNHTLRASRPFEELTYEEWRRVLAVVLDGVFFCCKACIPRMLERGGGAIVNLGGQAGITGTRRGAHATAAKSAVAGMTRALALEFADRGITVNTVHPWLIDTERGEGEPVRRGTPPIGRQGTVEEVAALVRLLCGPEGRYITGQSIHINGGGYMP